jgi:hypothetical protein
MATISLRKIKNVTISKCSSAQHFPIEQRQFIVHAQFSLCVGRTLLLIENYETKICICVQNSRVVCVCARGEIKMENWCDRSQFVARARAPGLSQLGVALNWLTLLCISIVVASLHAAAGNRESWDATNCDATTRANPFSSSSSCCFAVNAHTALGCTSCICANAVSLCA